jgi:hypothetical protein
MKASRTQRPEASPSEHSPQMTAPEMNRRKRISVRLFIPKAGSRKRDMVQRIREINRPQIGPETAPVPSPAWRGCRRRQRQSHSGPGSPDHGGCRRLSSPEGSAGLVEFGLATAWRFLPGAPYRRWSGVVTSVHRVETCVSHPWWSERGVVGIETAPSGSSLNCWGKYSTESGQVTGSAGANSVGHAHFAVRAMNDCLAPTLFHQALRGRP